MKIEIIEFYPRRTFNKKFCGELHIYIEEWDMDIRGVGVYALNKGFYIQLPQFKGEKDGEACWYPIVDFANKTTHQAFINEIRRLLEIEIANGEIVIEKRVTPLKKRSSRKTTPNSSPKPRYKKV